MEPPTEQSAMFTRRALFGRGAMGLGTAALASLLNADGYAVDGERHDSVAYGGLPDLPHFAAKGMCLNNVSLEEMEALWEDAKRIEREGD